MSHLASLRFGRSHERNEFALNDNQLVNHHEHNSVSLRNSAEAYNVLAELHSKAVMNLLVVKAASLNPIFDTTRFML